MRITLLKLLVIGLTIATWHSTADAQGAGGGLNRGPRGLGFGGAGPSNGPRTPNVGNRGGLNQGTLGRSGQGLSRAADVRADHGAARSPSSSGLNHSLKAEGNAERIRDKRIEQAEHLRGVSESNGNERLNDTADRMEASAQKNYARRTNTPTVLPDGSVRTDAATADAAKATKSSWLPNWLRRKS